MLRKVTSEEINYIKRMIMKKPNQHDSLKEHISGFHLFPTVVLSEVTRVLISFLRENTWFLFD